MAGPTPNRSAAQRASIAPETAPTPPAAKISPIVAGPSPSSRVA
jgi:hypothetical protein